MDTSIAILEGVDEYEAESRYRSRDNRIDCTVDDTTRERHPSQHQRRYISGARADEVHFLTIAANGLADEVLKVAPVRGGVARIDNLALQVH